MTNGIEYDDDDGGENFRDYIITTVDLGPIAFLSTALLCLFLFCLLPAAARRRSDSSTDYATVKSSTAETFLNVADNDDCCEDYSNVEIASAFDSSDGTTDDTDKCHHEIGWSRSSRRQWLLLDSLFSVAEFDNETRCIYKLALPYLMKAVVSGLSQNGTIIIIGQYLGARQLAAFAVVQMLVGLTSGATGGVHESLVTLLGFSRGTENHKLTGEYIQLAMVLYVLASIPFIFIWSLVIDQVMLLMSFDLATASIGRSFAVPYMFAYLLYGVTQCLHATLNVFDRAHVSTTIVCLKEIGTVISVFLVCHFWNPSLQTIGAIYVAADGLDLLVTVTLVAVKGWFQPYYSGLFQSLALVNTAALKMMLRTTSSITAGYLLTYGEWEILTFFAGYLGPAEVAAWSVLGTLWGSIEGVTGAIAAAAEIRVSLLLGSGQPVEAERSAFKSIFIAFMVALFTTSLLFLAYDDLPKWLTTDPVLQQLIAQLIPLLGLGNIALTMGSMAWTLVGAQNRYGLATCIGVAGSWLVTIPLSAVLSTYYRIDLKGQTAAVVIGYMMSGFVTNVVLLRSDWKALSDVVVLANSSQSRVSCDKGDDLALELKTCCSVIAPQTRSEPPLSTDSLESMTALMVVA